MGLVLVMLGVMASRRRRAELARLRGEFVNNHIRLYSSLWLCLCSLSNAIDVDKNGH